MEELKELEQQQNEGAEETTDLVEVEDYDEIEEETEGISGKTILAILGGVALGVGTVKAGEFFKKKYDAYKSKKNQQKDVVDAEVVEKDDSKEESE